MDGEVTVRGFYPSFEEKITHLVVGNKGFYVRNKEVLKPELFAVDNHRFLIQLVAGYVTEYGKQPCLETIRELVRQSNYRDRDGVLTILDSVNGYDDHDFVSKQLVTRARWSAIDQALAVGGSPEELAERIRKAAALGAAHGERYTTLGDDDHDDNVRNQIIPTPWKWLNDQLMGGPEKQDLAVVLSVVNGGKTTSLVNIAYGCLQEGLTVVYFTFEDGQRKIKRRIKQRVSNMTFEELINHRERADYKCKKFLEVYGGKCIIKTLATRRDTVADAASVLRHLPDKPDVIITDYADRFRARTRYDEPRHALKEVFEDCKQLAKDFDVLHWSARQVNKSRVGKNIVGIEHAEESWGTMQSPDLVIGFGRSLEDERLGRMTLYTAKVRDHECHKTCTLMADFDRQKMWDYNE
jgi:hypothetical protein